MKTKYIFLNYLKLVLLLPLAFLSCSQSESEGKQPDEQDGDVAQKEEILFIGNSHTYYNQGIDFHLSKFRDNDDLEFKPLIQEVSKGGYTLQDHLEDQTTINKINERAWDVIVLQENTSIASETLQSSINAIKSLSDAAKEKGAKVYLFMTWPYKDQGEMLTGIRETYQSGAFETGAELVQVGAEWESIDANEEVDISLYDPDGIHPSLEGTFYASAMFYKAIYDKPPSENPYQAGLEPEIANYLKSLAD